MATLLLVEQGRARSRGGGNRGEATPSLSGALQGSSNLPEALQGPPNTLEIHEHDNGHRHRAKHYGQHQHVHQQQGRHIHNHEHEHNHRHVHDHGHKASHRQAHGHTVAGGHEHQHWRRYCFGSSCPDLGQHQGREGRGGGGVARGGAGGAQRREGGGEVKRPLPHQVASVEEYIGDAGRELEGAAEEIVESYMGEYMQVVLYHFSI